MRQVCHPRLFVFSDLENAQAAVETLVGAGVRSSRLSIHLWGRDFAVLLRDRVSPDVLTRLAQLGGHVDVSRVSPDRPATRTRRTLISLEGNRTPR